MKRIISLILVLSLMLSFSSFVFADNTYTSNSEEDPSTIVSYKGKDISDASYMITVPSLLKPGQSGDVTLEGSWPSSMTVNVTAEKEVELTNSIDNKTKILTVNFKGISQIGNNTSPITDVIEPVSVETISNALFGVWSGHFNYNVTPTEATSITHNWSKSRVLKESVTDVEFTYDEDAEIVSVEPVDGSTVSVEEKTSSDGSSIYKVKALSVGSSEVIATLDNGESTKFNVNVYELNLDDGIDVDIKKDVSAGDSIGKGDIDIDISITTPDGEGTITVTPEISDGDFTLEEGDNEIHITIEIDDVIIHITIIIIINSDGSSEARPKEKYTVNYIADENGSVSESSKVFEEGDTLTFPSVTANDGYEFDKWVDNDSGSEVTISTKVTSNMTVKATFKENAPLTFETAKIGEEFQFGYYNMAFNDERDVAGVIVVNTAQGGTIPITWVKVSDTLAICKDILRSTISWNRLNSAGFTTNWPLSIDNVLTYKVRLLKGGSNGEVGKPVTGGEWKTYVVDQGLQKSFNWQSSYFWCQESSAMYQGSINSKYSPQIDWRGYWCCDLKSESEDGGFRPVLERIR